MNALESRLAETEKALFFALSEIHSGTVIQGEYDSQPPDRSMHPSALSTAAPTHQQEKCDLMASWASQPLKNRDQAQAWLRSRVASTYQFVRDSSAASSDRSETSPQAFTSSATNASHGVDALRPPVSLDGPARGSQVHARKKRSRAPNGIRREPQYGNRWLDHAGIMQFDTAEENDGGGNTTTIQHPAPATDLERNSKARSLARGNQDIYF